MHTSTLLPPNFSPELVFLSGPSDCGKTTAIRQGGEQLRAEGGIWTPFWAGGTGEIYGTVRFEGFLLGLTSQGDPRSGLDERLDHLLALDCHILVAATRTRGTTLEAVNKRFVPARQRCLRLMRVPESARTAYNAAAAGQLRGMINEAMASLRQRYPELDAA